MPRSCTVCAHHAREGIAGALVGGASNRSVASLYDVSEAAVRRHKGKHLPAKLVMAQAAEEVAEADTLLDQVKNLQGRAYAPSWTKPRRPGNSRPHFRLSGKHGAT